MLERGTILILMGVGARDGAAAGGWGWAVAKRDLFRNMKGAVSTKF